VRLFTITAPGSDVLSCADAIEQWNAAMWTGWGRTGSGRWAALREAAAIDARRASKGQRSGILVVVPELQKRGALHLHVVMGADTPLERRWCEAFVRYCRQNGRRYGFGRCDFDAARGWTRAHESLSRYASKLGGYVAKVGGLRAMHESGELPARAFYVSRRLTSVTGLTMRGMRLRSRWRRATGQWLTAEQLCDLVELMDEGWTPHPLRT
jgi:hypothetical protein